MKLYNVFKNTGGWGGSSSEFIFAEDEMEAKVMSFGRRDVSENQKAYDTWISKRYDISVCEVIDGNDLLQKIVNFPKIPLGYKFTVDIKLEKLDS